MSFTLLGILNAQASGGAAGGAAFDLLESTILTSSASSVSFTGLGDYSDYKHLQIRTVARSTRTIQIDAMVIEFNGNTTGSNYDSHYLRGNGSAVASDHVNDRLRIEGNLSDNASSTGIFGASVIDVLDFSNSSKNTTVRALWSNGPSQGVTQTGINSGLFNNTAAVTSINLYALNGNLVTGSRFSLYGIKAA